jgi:predicted negative regulator of RcsB-dependent stress response
MIKNIIIIVFVIIGLVVIYNFRDHNQKRAIDACIAGSQKLDQPMTIEEAKKFCEEQIKS